MTTVRLPDRTLFFADGKEAVIVDTLLEHDPDVQSMMLGGSKDWEIAQRLGHPIEYVRRAFKGDQDPQSYWESLYGPCEVEWIAKP